MLLSRPSWARFDARDFARLRRRSKVSLGAFWHGVLGIAYSMILPALVVAVLAAVLGLARLFLPLFP